MSIQIQLRRGTALQHDTFTGANAELTVDTSNYALRLHDGSTAGGFEILRKDLSNLADASISNSKLANSSVTINGQSVSLGGSTTITATATNALTIGTGLSGSSYNGSSAVTISLSNTGVTAGSYGSTTAIPVLTINAQGQVTSATTVSVATNLSIDGDTGSDTIDLLSDTLSFVGADGIATSVSGNTVTISGQQLGSEIGELAEIIAAETTRAGNAEAAIASDLADEILRATAAEASIASDLSDEVNRAIAVETGLSNDLADEIDRATAAETALGVRIDNVLSNVDPGALDSLTEVVTAFQTADSNLNGAITALSSSLSSDIADETANRIAEDTVLQNNIDAEESARISADNTLQSNISSEASTRASADTTLQNNIDAEASTRASADTTLQNNIDAEETRAIAAETALDSKINEWERNLSFAQIGSGANFLPNTSYQYLKIFDQTISANSSVHFKIEFNIVQNGGNMSTASNYGEIYVDAWRTTSYPSVNTTYVPNDVEDLQINNTNILFTTSSAGQTQIWLFVPYQYSSVYGKLINLAEPDAGSPYSLQQVDLSRNNNWTTGYSNLGQGFTAEYRDSIAEDYYGTNVYATNLIPGSNLNLNSSSKYITLVDSAQIRLGTDTDSRIWYDGTSNTLDIELESTSTSFNVTNNGSDLFVVNRSTGNASVTGDLHVGGGDITTGSTTSSIFNTTATTVNAFGAATALSIGASSGTTTINNNTVITGNLTVNGTTTTVNSTTLAIDDKNIVLGDTASPTDVSADGGGITLKGTTDKTFNWVDATDAWTSSENLNLLTGKVYQINGTTVLSSTQVLGKSLPTGDVVGSSDTQTLTNKTLGDTTISGNLTPSVNATYDLGSSTYKFKDLYLSGSSIFLDATSIQTHASGIAFTHSTNTTVLPVGGGSHTLVTETGTATLTNKTLSSPTLTGTLTAGGGTGTNGQFLKSTGTGLEWATVTQVTYGLSAETVAGGANLRITGSDASTDDVKLAAGSNINITRTDANTITIESTASSSKFLVYKRGDVAPSSATPIVISSGQLTVYGRTQNIGVLV